MELRSCIEAVRVRLTGGMSSTRVANNRSFTSLIIPEIFLYSCLEIYHSPNSSILHVCYGQDFEPNLYFPHRKVHQHLEDFALQNVLDTSGILSWFLAKNGCLFIWLSKMFSIVCHPSAPLA